MSQGELAAAAQPRQLPLHLFVTTGLGRNLRSVLMSAALDETRNYSTVHNGSPMIDAVKPVVQGSYNGVRIFVAGRRDRFGTIDLYVWFGFWSAPTTDVS